MKKIWKSIRNIIKRIKLINMTLKTPIIDFSFALSHI